MELMVEAFVEAAMSAMLTGLGVGTLVGLALGLLAGVGVSLASRPLGAPLGWVGGLILTMVLTCAGPLALGPIVSELFVEQAVAGQEQMWDELSDAGADGLIAAAWLGGVNADAGRFLVGHAAVPREDFERSLRRFVSEFSGAGVDLDREARRMQKALAPHMDDAREASMVAAFVAALGSEGALSVGDLIPPDPVVDRAAVRRHLRSGEALSSLAWSMRILTFGWAGFVAFIAAGATGLALLLARRTDGGATPADPPFTA